MPDTARQDLTAILASVIREHQRKSREMQLAIFKGLVLNNDVLTEAAIKFFFDLAYNRTRHVIFPPTQQELEEQQTALTSRAARSNQEVAIIKGIIMGNLLDFMTLKNKRLRDCTGRDCTELGGFFAEIGERVNPDDKVGEVMTEQQIRVIAHDIWPIAQNPADILQTNA